MTQKPDKVWELATGHIGRRVQIYSSLPSTNDLAAELPKADGTVILARTQTVGRGQYGRTWQSPAGAAVLLSAVIDPPAELRKPVVLTAWAGVAVTELLGSLSQTQVAIKWPNDVLVRGKKISGILIEQHKHTVVGIGLNVNQSVQDFASASLPDATSLAFVTGRQHVCDEIARHLILTLDTEYEQLLEGNLQDLEHRWRERLGLIGRRVRGVSQW